MPSLPLGPLAESQIPDHKRSQLLCARRALRLTNIGPTVTTGRLRLPASKISASTVRQHGGALPSPASSASTPYQLQRAAAFRGNNSNERQLGTFRTGNSRRPDSGTAPLGLPSPMLSGEPLYISQLLVSQRDSPTCPVRCSFASNVSRWCQRPSSASSTCAKIGHGGEPSCFSLS